MDESGSRKPNFEVLFALFMVLESMAGDMKIWRNILLVQDMHYGLMINEVTVSHLVNVVLLPLRREALKRFPDLPIFLYGHSMGGNLVLNYILRRRPILNGVIVTSPWLKLAVEPPPLLKRFVRCLDKIWPTFSVSSEINVDALSHDHNVVESYKSDPLVHTRITVRLFTVLDQAARWALKNASQFDRPLLIMHGDYDSITSFEGSKLFAEAVQNDCTLKIWPGLFHELHKELGKGEVFAYLINWLEGHL